MFDSRQLNCMIRDRTATITPTSRPCQGFLVALYRTYRYAYLWWPGVEVADETMVAPHFFRGALAQLRIHLSLVARFEPAEKTVFASRNVSAPLNFAPHPLAPLLRGAGSFAAEGLTAISSPLRPPVARRERIYPFRVPWFSRQLPVGIPQ